MNEDLRNALIAVYQQFENQEKSLGQLRLSVTALREAVKEASLELEIAYGKHYEVLKSGRVGRANDLAFAALVATRRAIEDMERSSSS